MAAPRRRVPFDSTTELYANLHSTLNQGIVYLPSQPRIALNNSIELLAYLHSTFWASDLERIGFKLWLLTTQSSSNIWALHQQKVKGRNVILTEDPRLHLAWIYNRIFIKPLPPYLCSHAFWAEYLLRDDSPLNGPTPAEKQRLAETRQAALGFLRTYFHLIQHESDFDIASSDSLRLLPRGVTWVTWCNFSKDLLLRIQDDDVSARYHFGEIRLTRLNLWSKILLWKFHYETVEGQYGAFFARFYGPLLFVFGVLSVILSAMQVEIGAETLLIGRQWPNFWLACRWFTIVILAFMGLIILGLMLLLIGMVLREIIYAVVGRWKKARQQANQQNP